MSGTTAIKDAGSLEYGREVTLGHHTIKIYYPKSVVFGSEQSPNYIDIIRSVPPHFLGGTFV